MLPSDIRLFCLLQSGKPLTKGTYDALVSAAVRMARHGRRKLFIRSKDSDGLLETDLEPVEWCDMYGMNFTVNLMTPQGYTKVTFFIRIDDLDNFDINNTVATRGTVMPAHAVPFPLPPGIPPNTPVVVCPIDEDDDDDEPYNGFGPSDMN